MVTSSRSANSYSGVTSPASLLALAWLVGVNPRLGEATPVSAVRDLETAQRANY